MIITCHHTSTWWVVWDFTLVYSLWILWWGVQLLHAFVFLMLKPAKYSNFFLKIGQVAISRSSCSQMFFKIGVLKGNPNFQDILNWISQILDYYCRKQHKNITDYWTKSSSLFSFLSVYCNLCFLLPSSSAEFFHFFNKVCRKFIHRKWSFVLYIVLFSSLKMIFTKFSQLDIPACIKNWVYNNFNLHCYFMSSIIERLQISLL